MKHYTRLTVKDREELSRMLATGHRLRYIASALGRSPSTLSRELHRNRATSLSYRAISAHKRAYRLAHKRRKPIKLDFHPQLKNRVFKLLAQRWSPQQIAKDLDQCYPNDPTMQISHETLYTYLYVLARGSLKRQLIRYLRQHHSRRRPRNKVRLKTNPIQDIISIEERPQEVADRTVPGHWEGDLLMGRRNASALGTLVERTTRFTLLVPLRAKDALSVREAFAREMKRLPEQLRKSLTYDQGQEMKEHRLFTKQTRVKVYFAHPRCPWERGTNENTNGLLRQFFPKGTDFTKLTTHHIKHVQKLFNGRPRRVLNWCKPQEVFSELLH